MTILSGANARIALKKESVFGVAPAGNWELIPIASFELSEQQQFSDNDLIGQGSDTLRPQREVSEFSGNVTVPVDLRAIGHWLTAAFGAPTTTTVPAAGAITFTAQPADNSTITLNGVVWTFVAGTPSGTQIQKGGSLSATLDAAVTALNASANASISAATYAKSGTTVLTIAHDTAGTAGNAYALAASAASNGTVSAPTLAGGGYKHAWQSGGSNLPSYAAERQHPDGSTPLYAVYTGIKVDGFTLGFEPTGRATMQFQVNFKQVGRGTSSAAGTPTAIDVKRFSHYQSFARKDGVDLAKVVSAQLPYALNNEKVRYVGGEGAVGDIIPGIRTSNGQLVTRFEDWALFDVAKNETTFQLDLGFQMTAGQGGWRLKFSVDQVEIGNPADPISGPAGIQATFPLIGSKSTSTGRMLYAELVTDVASY